MKRAFLLWYWGELLSWAGYGGSQSFDICFRQNIGHDYVAEYVEKIFLLFGHWFVASLEATLCQFHRIKQHL